MWSSVNVNTNGTTQWPPCLKWLWEMLCNFIQLYINEDMGHCYRVNGRFANALPEWWVYRQRHCAANTYRADSAGGGTWALWCVTLWKVRTVFNFRSSVKHNSVTHRNTPISLGERQLWVYKCRFTVFKNKVVVKIVQLRNGN